MRYLLALCAPRSTPPSVESIVGRGTARGMTAELADVRIRSNGTQSSPDGQSLQVARLDGTT